MADLPDSAVAPGTWELDNLLDFSIGSPTNIFGWNSDDPAGNFGEGLLLSGLEIQAQDLQGRGSEEHPGGQGDDPTAGRIRKRDPRLTCENFLAGRVPCACPEVDEMEEEEEYDGRAKRAKAAVVRCQVPSCEADISQLKGYHRRHRVCLRCANAVTVVLDGVPKRYCQQCGKFHLLPDFDEGKRSCRRKLERHNNRRRRKPVGDKASAELLTSRTESPPRNADVEPYNDGKSGQESKSLSSFGTGEKQASSGSEELQISEVEQPYKDRSCLINAEPRSADAIHIFSSLRPVNVSTEVEGKHLPVKNIRHGENFNDLDMVVENPQASPSTMIAGTPDGDNSTYADFNQQSYTGFLMEENSHKDHFLHCSAGLTRRDEGSGPLGSSLSSTGHKRYPYTSVCPTGRISFKLYDWNPAEFPRRLRQQILQWLANMPIELEGYIRPGCTILTAFIALPQYMWDKLNGDSTSYVCDLLNTHGSILSGRGNMLVYLNNIVMQIENGEASLVNNKMSQQVPWLYSVHPVFVEAGRPIEIVACGKNLFQSKFRFLISFGGSYLRYDSCETIPLHKIHPNFRSKENIIHPSSIDSCKIVIPSTDSRLFGPAFVEVENESGISNFIPILIGNKQICSEFQLLEHQLMDCALCCTNDNEHVAIPSLNFDVCKQNLMKRQSILELLLDIGWVLKDPERDENEIPVNNGHIKRLSYLLGFLIEGRFLSVIEKVLHSPKVIKMLNAVYAKYNEFNDVDVELLQNYVKHAWLSVRKNPEDKSNDSSRQFLEKVVMHGLPSKAESASKLQSDQFYECSGGREEIEETQADVVPPSGLQSVDVRILSVAENSMLRPLLEKECFSNISNELNRDSKLGFRKMIDVVRCAQRIKIELKRDSRVDRRIVILTIAVVAVCAGICVVLQHPHRVMEMSMSLRRCLFGLRKGQEASLGLK